MDKYPGLPPEDDSTYGFTSKHLWKMFVIFFLIMVIAFFGLVAWGIIK